MDYEKEYKEALKRAIFVKENTDSIGAKDVSDVIEYIFSELRENEDDKIRKRILLSLEKDLMATKNSGCNTKDLEECITWLEKQGEQKLINDTDEEIVEAVKDTSVLDLVEPRFKVGDWIISNVSHEDYRICKILKIENDEYVIESIYGYQGHNNFEAFDKDYHHWTIQDANDGDVLQLGEVTAIFKKYIGNEHCTCYCSFCKDGGFEIPIENGEDNVYGYYDDTTPATKEQRDFLFSNMKEAGYEWDADKKELKIIDWSKHIKYDPNGPSIFTKKSTWSEEDEVRLTNIIIMLKEGASHHFVKGDITNSVDWLKSLKDRYTWKPSEKQIKVLKVVKDYVVSNNWNDCICNTLKNLLEQLKKL